MKTFIQKGKVLQYTNAGSAITSGTVLITGNGLIGVATGDIAASTGVGEIAVEGVFTLPSDTGTAWVMGDRVFWDDSGKVFTKTALANAPGGWAAAAKLSATATASVKLGSSPVGRATNVATVSAAAAATAGGSGPTAAQVDTGIATAIAPLTTGINAILTALKAAGIMANS